MEMAEIGVKVVFKDGEPAAMIMQNGSLKFYKLEQMGFADIDEVFDKKSAMISKVQSE